MTSLIKISENWKKLQDEVYVSVLPDIFSCIFPAEKENYPHTTQAIYVVGLLVSNTPDTTSSTAIVSHCSLTVIVTNNCITRERFSYYVHTHIYKKIPLCTNPKYVRLKLMG